MAKFALVGTIEVAPGRKEQLVAALMAHRARCPKDDPGTLQMEVLAPRDDHTRLLLYEVYRDDAAFDVHRDGPSFAQRREETAGAIAEFSVTRCTPVESGASIAHV